jgi:hypothetical protein
MSYIEILVTDFDCKYGYTTDLTAVSSEAEFTVRKKSIKTIFLVASIND